ncbi:MAG: flagellar motor protein [Calothrix sp. MO_167.B12]|nr:flagellar motor protein [Calothrix sp. MO_167.B12]
MSKNNRIISTPEGTFNIWTSFTDLMSNAFMIITLVLLFFVAKVSETEKSTPKQTNNEPTIFSLPSDKYSFKSGKAVLPGNLKKDISGENGIILKMIEKELAKLPVNDKQSDVIQVIGHTDGQPVGTLPCGGGNLDTKLELVSRGSLNIGVLCPNSNADLGLMRALAVVKELQVAQQKLKTSKRFKKIQFRAYSAAQLLLTDDKGFAPKDRRNNLKRRRIDIRFAQPGKYVTPDDYLNIKRGSPQSQR